MGMVGKTMCQLLQREGYTNVITKNSLELNLCNQRAVEDFFESEKPEYVFHFAAKVGGIMANIKNPSAFLYDNIMISANVINCSYKYKVTKLLNLGSACIYPRECNQPIKEEYLMAAPLESANEGYSLAKIVALKLCEYHNREHSTNFISLIPCNIYGINDRFDTFSSHVVPALIMKFHIAKMNNQKSVSIWGTGNAKKEFIYVEDLARASLYFMQNYSAVDLNNSHINIGRGIDISIEDLSELIAKIVGYNGIIEWDYSKPEGIQKRLLDISKMKKLNSVALVNIEEGIQKTYDYYLKISKI